MNTSSKRSSQKRITGGQLWFSTAARFLLPCIAKILIFRTNT